MRSDTIDAVQPRCPTIESLEGRLCLSAPHHHFFTGVRPHFETTTIMHHRRHHSHTGVRARTTVLNQPPANFTNGGLGMTGTGATLGIGTGLGGLFGGSGSPFGGGGSIFSSTVPSASGVSSSTLLGSSPATGTGSFSTMGGSSVFSATGPMF
jgi:hypothetical protein